jgi:hypothetical protein
MKLNAQELITTGGDYFSNGTFSMSSTIGETVVETFPGNDNTLTQGFQQSKLNFYVIDEPLETNLIISVFPNPVKENLTINIENSLQKMFSYKVYGTLGKLIMEGISNNNLTEVSFQYLPPALYLLKIFVDEENIRGFSILKIP